MRWSDDRILTTHAGSLPRPPALVRALCEARRRRGGRPRRARCRRPRRPAPDRAKADRGRHRRRQQWRAAARGLLPLRPAPHERLWRQLAAPAARRRRPLSDLPADAAGAAGGPHRGQQFSAAQGDLRGALPRPGGGARRVRGFSERAGGGRRRLRRAVPDRTIARHRRRGDEERALRQRGGLSHSARRCAAGRVRGDRRPRVSVATGLPGPRPGAAHQLPGPAARRFPSFRRAGGERDQPRAGPCAARSGPPARLLGQLRGPARHGRAAGGDPADHPQGARRRLRVSRSPTRATPTSIAASRPRAPRAGRWTTTRSWSRA